MKIFTRYIYHPITQAVRGQRILKYLRELRSNERLPREYLDNIRRSRLLQTLRLAAKTNFYRERFQKAESDSDYLDIFHNIPYTTKTDVQSYILDLKPDDFEVKILYGRTSGSTGISVKLQYDSEWDQRSQAAQLRGKSWWHVSIGEKELVIWGRPLDKSGDYWKNAVKLRLMNRMQINPFDLTDETLDKLAPKIIKFKPRYIYGYSTGIGRLAEFFLDKYGVSQKIQPKAVITTAESLYEPHREAIRKAFGVEAGSEYGSAEAGIIAYSCPAGNLHINYENVHLQIDNPDDAGFGGVIVTPLLNRAMVLLKYKLGDLGRLVEGYCACGRTLPIFEIAHARETEIVEIDGKAITSSLFFGYVRRSRLPEDTRQFRVIQKRERLFEVQIVRKGEPSKEVEQGITEIFRQYLSENIQVEFTYHEALTPDKSGKLRYFVKEDF